VSGFALRVTVVGGYLVLLGRASVALAAAPETATEIAPAPPPPPVDRGEMPWIERWAPERNTVDIGVLAGIWLPSPHLDIFDEDASRPDNGYLPFSDEVAGIGGRIGYFPIRFFGIEAEGVVMPTTVPVLDEREEALVWSARGQLVAQAGLWSITPFVVVGVGALGVRSDDSAVGNDTAVAGHIGAGVKFFVNRQVSLRIEARDVISSDRVDSDAAHSVEALAGVAFTIGRRPAPPPPPAAILIDTDADTVPDPEDACPNESGLVAYRGCPIPDCDDDGVADPDDTCRNVPGTPDLDGCPIPDLDGDGILDPDDACRDQAGVAGFQGCPVPDQDSDGIRDPDDACPSQAEDIDQGDKDGCPEEAEVVPDPFNGVIQGISFRLDGVGFDADGANQLNEVVALLQRTPAMRIEVSGHTDDVGGVQYNFWLSEQRAIAVKQYLVEGGVESRRIETRGAGEMEPLGSNLTPEGRALNRRIEFRILDE